MESQFQLPSSRKITVANALRKTKFSLVPSSHWLSLGYDIEYIRVLERFQHSLIDCIRRPRRSVQLQPVDEGGNWLFGVQILHDSQLMGLWKYLAIAILSRDDCYIDTLNITNVQLDATVMGKLAESLKQRNLKKLILGNNSFGGGEGLLFAADVMRENVNMKSLELHFNIIDDLDATLRLAEVLGGIPHFESLNLRYCEFGNDPLILSSLASACNSVKFLDVRNTNVGSQGATILAQYVASNPSSLETINLCNNEFNDEDALLFADALRKNKNLKLMYLSNNNIFEQGRRALLSAIFDNSSLNSVYESNHTCELNFDGLNNLHQEMMLINNFTDAETNRKRKIVTALHDATDDNSYFNVSDDVPIEFMPDVLELMQYGVRKYRNSSLLYNQCFNLMFGVLRIWKMPLLYSFLKGDSSLVIPRGRKDFVPNLYP